MRHKSTKQRKPVISKKIFVALLAVFIVTISSFVIYAASYRAIPILMYHSVSLKKGDNSSTVTLDSFRKQMEFLNKNGYKVISLDDLVGLIKAGTTYVPKTVVITFDDGEADNFTNAFPVLSKYRMPATIFLITGRVGKVSGYLNWDQAAIMGQNGISFGGHTRGHTYLPSVKGEGILWQEIRGTKEDIEKNLNVPCKYFCFPIGGFNNTVKEVVREAGYFGACTTNRGRNPRNSDVYALKRIKVTDSDGSKPFNFEAKLSGLYNTFKRSKTSE